MCKLFVLVVMLAVVAARPEPHVAAPVVYADPAATTTFIQEPILSKIGAVVKSIPTAVSHQSVTQVHSTPIIEDIVAPVVKTAALHSAAPGHVVAAAAVPIVKTAAPVAFSAPVAPVAYSVPVPYNAHVAAYHASPLTYAAAAPIIPYHSPLTYAAPAW